MGGRMASLVADRLGVAGLICLGYPFHPPGRPERTRTDHLAGLATPTLILQGERDRLGNRQDVDGYVLSSAIQVHWLADGDHDLSPRKKSGHTVEQNWNDAIEAITVFLRRL
jgi:predicted alpha/beta-hydrolase family hydrolase